MQKIQTKDLPESFKRHLKSRKFSKREISVDIKDVTTVHQNQHAPQYDNFDYSYYDLMNLKTGELQSDLQDQLHPSVSKTTSKSVHLNDEEVMISGDRVNGYASLTMNQNTFNQHFSSDLKTVNKMLKGAMQKLINLKKANVSIEKGASGILIKDLESKIGEKAVPHHKEGKRQLAAANEIIEANKDKISKMKFREALRFISDEVQKKTGKYFSWNSWDSWQ